MLITGISQAAFNHQANGSLIVESGKTVGSELIGQPFAKPEYFHPRPSAAGNGYNAGKPEDSYTGSSGTNLGPTSDKMLNGIHKKTADGKDDPGNYDGIKNLAAAYRTENGLTADQPVPADAVTRSASGLDPHISPENARIQVGRVATARKMGKAQVEKLINENTDGRGLFVFGEAGVNVLKLNRVLDAAKK